MNWMDFGDLDFGFGLILDFGFGSELKIALAIIHPSPTQRPGAVWKPKMAVKGASRAKENLHSDTYFHVRTGFEAFRERYFKG